MTINFNKHAKIQEIRAIILSLIWDFYGSSSNKEQTKKKHVEGKLAYYKSQLDAAMTIPEIALNI